MVVVTDDELQYVEGQHELVTYKPQNWREQLALDRSVTAWRFLVRHAPAEVPPLVTLEARELPTRPRSSSRLAG